MKRFGLAVCTALLLAGCGGKTPTAQRTVVAGQVINRSDNAPAVIMWNLCDPYANYQLIQPLAPDGSFRFETDELTGLHDATIVYDRCIDFFVAPGDSIHLTIDASRFGGEASGEALRFGGDRAAENTELTTCIGPIQQMLNSEPMLDLATTPDSIILEIRSRMARYEDSLARFTTVGPTVRDFVRRHMLFCLANELLIYRPQEANARLTLLADPIFGLHDPANLRSMMFPYHLNTYMREKVSSDTTVFAALLARDFGRAARNGVRMLETEPATANRDVMMWQFLSSIAGDFPVLCDSIPEVRRAFVDRAHYTRLQALCDGFKAGISFPETPIEGVSYLTAEGEVEELPKGDVFAFLTAKYPGRVLYIDVYATWCGPCLEEIKAATELHEAMRGKPVVFVNLCLTSDRKSWIALNPEGENFWFDRTASQLFIGTYNISGFPTYLLVGADGHIASMEAEQPSALPYVAEQIEELLAQ